MHLVLAFLLLTRVAFADDNPELYHCERKPTTVAVSFKPETDLKELVSWAMGFTCKNFMFDPSYVQRGKKINIVTPETMTPDQTRTIETRLVAHDQQTVMLTGLTQIKELDLKTKVPILGDIPVLGTLFSYTSKEKVKSNLVILLTPYIIRSRLDIDQIRERHQREQDKKRGLVEEINRSVGSVQDEAAARAQLAQPTPVQIGPVH